MKYTMFFLISGLLALAILPGPVFAGGQTNDYEITIEIITDPANPDVSRFLVTAFTTAGQANRSGIRFDGLPEVDVRFPEDVLLELASADEDVGASHNDYPWEPENPRRSLYWSPLEDDWLGRVAEGYWNRFPGTDHLQDLNTSEVDPLPYPETWRFYGDQLDYKTKTLTLWFRRCLYYYTPDDQGACDQYEFTLRMNFEDDTNPYEGSGTATLNFVHYTFTVSKKPGRKLDVPSQQLRDSSSHYAVVTIETLPPLGKPAAPPAEPSTWGQIKSLLK